MSELVDLIRSTFVACSPKGRSVRAFRITADILPATRETIADEMERLEQEVNNLRAKLAAAEKRFTTPIVCMCGSTKFKQTWIAENARLTGEGNIVLAVGLWGHHERKYPAPDVKVKLDDLHKRKIDLCDWVWVLDVDGYIGESTRSEIEYAKRLDKPIRYLSKEFSGYKEPVDQLDEYKAHNALLVGAVREIYKNTSLLSDESRTGVEKEVDRIAGNILESTPSEAYERVQGLVEALERILSVPGEEGLYVIDAISKICSIADNALQRYRGEKE